VITLVKQVGLVRGQTLAVDKGSVGAAQIDHCPASWTLLETNVLPRDARFRQTQIAPLAPADDDRLANQGDTLAGQWSLLDDQSHTASRQRN
jgi:hypothetical protein